MSRKTIIKITVDFLMVVVLLFLMAYMLTGQKVHEWLGVDMFALMVAHHILNLNWLKGLEKGKYTPFRILQTAINSLVFLCMVGSMISGMLMSRHVFPFLSIPGGMSFARSLHMLAAYWGFLLMSLHLGLHGKMFRSMFRGMFKLTGPSLRRTILLRGVAVMIAVYGLYAFLYHNIASYMLLRVHFVFFDFERPVSLFFVEYIGMMGLFAIAAYYLTGLVQKISLTRRGKENME